MGSVSDRGGLLYFDFRSNGVRCREYTKLDSTPANRRRMEAVLKKIETDIALGTFDYATYFPTSPMVAKLKAEAAALAAAAAETAPGVPLPRPAVGPVFRDFVTVWRADRQIEWRHSYRETIESILETHLLPAFGEMQVSAIDRAAILAFRTRLGERRIAASDTDRGRPLSGTTINRIIGILRQILDEAAARYDFTNPALKIKRLKGKKVDIEPFSMTELRLLIDRIRGDWKPYLTIRFFTGMRSAEAHGLKWKHVDFVRRELLIRETFHNGRTEYTKTDGSQREIAISQPVLDALMQLRPEPFNPEGYVFRTRTGHPIDNKNFNFRVWQPLLRHLGLKQRRPYQMRHTCATLWLAAGENPQWIARQLGHTTTEMLFRTYARFVPNLTRQDGTAFDRMITGAVHGGVKDRNPPALPPEPDIVQPKKRGRPRTLPVNVTSNQSTEVRHG